MTPFKKPFGLAKSKENVPTNGPQKCKKKVELCLLNHNVGEQRRHKNAYKWPPKRAKKLNYAFQNPMWVNKKTTKIPKK